MVIEYIENNDIIRFRILLAIYEKSDQNELFWCDVQQLATMQGINSGEFEKNYQYLIGEGLLLQHGSGFTAHISHEGIKEVEFIIKHPTKTSEHFPPYSEMGLSAS